MSFRIATLNIEQDHKRWHERRELIVEQWGKLRPDLLAVNELCVPDQSGRWLQRAARERLGLEYRLIQQSKPGDESPIQGEGLLTRYAPIEIGNLDYRSHNCVALVTRFDIEGRLVDVYVTHLIAVRVDESARREQVERLLEWVRTRDAVGAADAAIVCGDFNAAPEKPSTQQMAKVFHATQFEPTAFTPLREVSGEPTHPDWPRFDRCIDYIWIKGKIRCEASGLCFNQPAADDPDLRPSDHVGVRADLSIS